MYGYLFCPGCGAVYYSVSARERIESGDRCDRCGERFVAGAPDGRPGESHDAGRAPSDIARTPDRRPSEPDATEWTPDDIARAPSAPDRPN